MSSTAAAATHASVERNELRREMRRRRRRLTTADQAIAARAFARVLKRSGRLRPGTHVAIYHRHGHEADPSAIIALARRLRCTLYLPVITRRRSQKMEFLRFDADTPLRTNSFGILEPDRQRNPCIPPRRLDLILLPVLAVDAQGWRLGSGAGYYDRRLNFLRAGRRWRRPKLIGIAYAFQLVPRLKAESWDVPLDAVVTEQGFHPFNL